MQFQSTLPVWGATIGVPLGFEAFQFQSTLPVWGATLITIDRDKFSTVISIHAPRVGSDGNCRKSQTKNLTFQSTLPVWGATPVPGLIGCFWNIFQSTLPVWGATWHCGCLSGCRPHFNPRSPCGERLVVTPISQSLLPFQSTLPVWGATHYGMDASTAYQISIHAPRVGSDLW